MNNYFNKTINAFKQTLNESQKFEKFKDHLYVSNFNKDDIKLEIEADDSKTGFYFYIPGDYPLADHIAIFECDNPRNKQQLEKFENGQKSGQLVSTDDEVWDIVVK